MRAGVKGLADLAHSHVGGNDSQRGGVRPRMDEPMPDFRRWTPWTKMKVGSIAVAIVAIPLVVWNVILRMPGKSYAGALPPLSAPEASARDSLRDDLHHLVATIGERNVRHPESLARARDWIEARFRSAGYETRLQTFDADGVHCSNIVAERRGGAKDDEIVLVGAHYDSAEGTAGANDNGSGLVALLELARKLAGRAPDRCIRFVAFVNEEQPYSFTDRMGSVVHATLAASAHERIVAMLSLETMGYFSDEPQSQKYPFPLSLLYPERGNFIAFVGNVDSRNLVRKTIGLFRETTRFPSEGAALPERTTGVGWSDHAPFWKAGYPALMVTDTAFFRYRDYHTARDTDDKVDVDRLARVVTGLERVIEGLSRESW
jgi:hypothetical protein